jgi:predicted nucleic acid-binding protein
MTHLPVTVWTEDDAHHKEVASICPSLLKTHRGLITSNLVVAESYILLLKGLGHSAAMNFLESISKQSTRIVHPLTGFHPLRSGRVRSYRIPLFQASNPEFGR